MEKSYYCKMDSIKQLNFYCSDKVRWLDIVKDYDMIKEYFKVFNVDIEAREPNRMYFGINIDNYSETEPNIGKLCAFIYENKILAFGVLSYEKVDYISADAWEICAGSTHPEYFNRGYAKAVCSFIAKYILENNKQAVCETNINNIAAQKVLQGIGMVQFEHDRA
jgi:ribosomal protein S18 acetylase RimI-like enzyme